MSEKKKYKAINLPARAAAHSKPWQPECLHTVDDSSHSFKLAKFHGTFPWHSHQNTDETFLVMTGGPIRIDLNTSASTPEEAEAHGATETVSMGAGDLFCVPRGMQHRPVADVEAGVLMVEKVGTVNTGERVGSEMEVVFDERGR